MPLMLHAGAKPIDYDGLRALTVPEPTATHVPIAHYRVIDLVSHALGYYGHQVVESDYGVTEDGMRFFGVLTLKSDWTGYTDVLGLRNSHDKSFPIGLAFGSRVFICDNMAFVADHVIKRKHTQNAKRDLPGLIGEIIEPLALAREKQHQQILTYQATPLTDGQADQAIMQMYRQGVLNIQRVPDVIEQWDSPKHDWGEKAAWRLFNAATFALAGKVVEQADVTPRLHKIVDAVCTELH
jgi:hypothetical protein